MNSQNLAEDSKSYHSEAAIYERFSQAEDSPGKIVSTLGPLIAGKELLDLGCGTGKYLSAFAHLFRQYYGADISPQQLAIAATKAKGMANTSLICSSAEKTGLPDDSLDVVLSAWVIGTIQGVDRRASAISESERVLRPKGCIYLVENDLGGEFEEIRGRYPDTFRTQEYNLWLEQDMGFAPLTRFTTSFLFSSTDEAKEVIGAIWGLPAAELVKDRAIEHNVIIYCKAKPQPGQINNGGGQK